MSAANSFFRRVERAIAPSSCTTNHMKKTNVQFPCAAFALLQQLHSSSSQLLVLIPTFSPTYPFGSIDVGDNVVERTLPPTINTGALTGRGQPSLNPTYKPSYSPTTQDFGNIQVEVPGIEEETVRPPGETEMPTYYPTISSRESSPAIQSNGAATATATAEYFMSRTLCCHNNAVLGIVTIGYYLLLEWFFQ